MTRNENVKLVTRSQMLTPTRMPSTFAQKKAADIIVEDLDTLIDNAKEVCVHAGDTSTKTPQQMTYYSGNGFLFPQFEIIMLVLI